MPTHVGMCCPSTRTWCPHYARAWRRPNAWSRRSSARTGACRCARRRWRCWSEKSRRRCRPRASLSAGRFRCGICGARLKRTWRRSESQVTCARRFNRTGLVASRPATTTAMTTCRRSARRLRCGHSVFAICHGRLDISSPYEVPASWGASRRARSVGRIGRGCREDHAGRWRARAWGV